MTDRPAWAPLDRRDRGASPQPAADPARRRPLGSGTVAASVPRVRIADFPCRTSGHVGGLLVVADDADVRLLLKLMLQGDPRLGEQSEAATAEAAIRLLDVIRPALIVLDQEIQGSPMSGLALARKMKVRVPRAHILLLSAVMPGWQVEQESSVDAFLWKGDISALRTTARRLLDTRG